MKNEDVKLNLNTIAVFLGIIISVATITYGTVQYLNATYAFAQEFNQHKIETQYQFLNIKLDKLNNRIWDLETRLEKKPNDLDTKKDLAAAKNEKEITIKKIDSIEQKALIK